MTTIIHNGHVTPFTSSWSRHFACRQNRIKRFPTTAKNKYESGFVSLRLIAERLAARVHGQFADWRWCFRSDSCRFLRLSLLEDGGRRGAPGRVSGVPVLPGGPDVQQQAAHQHAHHPGWGEPAVRQGYRRNNWSSNNQGFYEIEYFIFQL